MNYLNLSIMICLMSMGCEQVKSVKTAPARSELSPALSGEPSWLPIGGEVYQEGSVPEAEQRVLAVRSQPRWFLGYSRPVSREEYDAYVSKLKRRTKFEEQERSIYFLPVVPPYPRKLEDLPLDDHGVRLAFHAHPTSDTSIVGFDLLLTSTQCSVWREVEHRWTNTLPLLFAFYVDGKAVKLTCGGFEKEGGINYTEELISAGGYRSWKLSVESSSLCDLLPDRKTHILAVVAAFSERQHIAYLGSDDFADIFLLMDTLPAPSTDGSQILVRSRVEYLRWTGAKWVSLSEKAVQQFK